MKNIVIILLVLSIAFSLKKSKCKEIDGTLKCEVKPDDSPEHQDFVKGKKLAMVVEEDADAEVGQWDQTDQGRNWGWQCAKGYKQSPIDIAKATAQNAQTAEIRTTIRFGLKEDAPKMKTNVGTNGLELVPDGDDIGEIVIHPSQDPKTALSYMVKRIHINTPSEHSIDLQHRGMEIQFEGCLNLAHSLIRPGVATKKVVPSKLFVAILVDVGSPSPFFQEVVNSIEIDEEGKKDPEGKEIDEKKVSFYDLLKFNDQWEDAAFAMQEGSLTTPPCTENALWVVFLDSIRAGTEQIRMIDSMWNIKPSRSLQKVNRRPITYSTYESRTIRDAIMKRIVRRKEDFIGVLPAYIRNHREYPLDKETDEDPDSEEADK